ncbi:dTDP-6-deoxy-3/4-keto-hexulose isomerase domain protein [Synechococcus sp. SYN20]|uniref:WxcM-like domain-containing protein n=1 Tax=Synechococcus sp. SYN20 TaxID=1050714 RepID=UPI001648F293|nr:WxcM-like domain-containing protein [Synechococcus sp. SYN20]QNJ24562.1 dTDP-6-deoxy-3/4-keto-hexulose isomerase domain protein [Synechococcus sp. SYN20]
MNQDLSSIGQDCIISPTVVIEDGASIGTRAILDAEGIKICSGARLDAGCIIGENVTVGYCARVRAGSVVLHSVPANAIVEGNPAQVIGYQPASTRGTAPIPRLIDILSFDRLGKTPCIFPLDIGESALYLMRQVTDSRGSLTVGEVPSEIPFEPKRYFVVYDVPSSELRGEHAHKECEQFLICVNGSVRVLLDDGINRCEAILDRPEMGIYMPAMIWGTQYQYTKDAVLLVFASMPYSSSDYIRRYEEFVALKKLPPQ